MTETTEARAWLMRGWKLDREIAALMRTYEDTRAMVMSVTANLQGDVVQSTKNPHKFDKLTELDDTINERIDELVAIKEEIVSVINRIDDSRYRTLLLERYTQFKTFEQIAVDMHYSWRRTMSLHAEALIKVYEIIS